MSEAPWLQEGFVKRVLVVGAGGIGSWACLALTKMGIKTRVFDFDKVEEHNIGGQLYGYMYNGLEKVKAMQHICGMLSESERLEIASIRLNGAMLSMHLTNTEILLMAVDNMETRKDLFNSWKDLKIPFLIDVRMSAEVIHVYVVDRSSEAISRYQTSLFDDKEVAEDDCTFKATTYCGMMAGSIAAAAVSNIFFERPLPSPKVMHIPSMFEIEMDPP
jgi:hypothetical protein